jgi:hypothetical protein
MCRVKVSIQPPGWYSYAKLGGPTARGRWTRVANDYNTARILHIFLVWFYILRPSSFLPVSFAYTRFLCWCHRPLVRERVSLSSWKNKNKRDNFCINKTTTIVVSFSIWPLGFYLFLSFSGGSLFVMAPLIKRDVISWRVYMNTIDTKGRMYNYQAIAKTSAPLCFSHFFNRVPSIYLSRLRYNGEQWRIYTPDRHIYECVYVQYIQVMDSPPHFPAGTFKNMTILRGALCSRAYLPYHVCVYIAISLKVAHIIYDTIHNMNAAATV